MIDKRYDLQRFLAVADTGTILSAADKLSITQPALSRFISNFEKRFACRLFDRSHAGVRLTQLGRIVEERARHILNEIDIAEEAIRAAVSGRVGNIVVATDGIWVHSLLPSIIYGFHDRFPDIDLKLLSTTYANGIRRLTNHECDLYCGNLSVNAIHTSALFHERLMEVTWGIVAHKSHPLHSRIFVHEDLVEYPWINFDTISPTGDPGENLPCLTYVRDELFRKTGKRIRSVVHTGSTGLCVMGGGPFLSYLPLMMVANAPEAALAPLPTDFARRLHPAGIVTRRASSNMAPCTYLRNVLRERALRPRPDHETQAGGSRRAGESPPTSHRSRVQRNDVESSTGPDSDAQVPAGSQAAA